MADENVLTPESVIPPERPPFAGVLPRAGAFLIDCFALYFIARLLGSLRPGILGLNPWLPWLGHLVALAYFWIGDGPLAKGATLGRVILNLHVVDAGGRPLTWGASLRRALLKQCVLFINLNPPYYALGLAPIYHAVLMGLSVLSAVSLTLLITLVLGIALHPRKRAWHDLWAGSYVTAEPTPASFRATLDAGPDILAERKMAMHLRMTLIFFVLAASAMLFGPVYNMFQPRVRKQGSAIAAAQRAAHPAPYVVTSAGFPDYAIRDEIEKMIRDARHAAEVAKEAVPTTDSLRAKFSIDAETIYADLIRRQGAFAPADLNDPALRAAIERLRRNLWAQWRALDDTATRPPARQFVAQLFEPFQILFYNSLHSFRLCAKVHGPADPQAGALTFEITN
jgi:uncharacterized RDD family membrane protein YckC